jgi:hypothetical protein
MSLAVLMFNTCPFGFYALTLLVVFMPFVKFLLLSWSSTLLCLGITL